MQPGSPLGDASSLSTGGERGAPAPDPPKRGIGKTLRDLAIGLFVAYFIGEALVLLIWGEQPKFPRRVVEAPWGLRYNDPGVSYRHKSADVNVRLRTNRQGMRADADYAYDKPAGRTRIVSLGDSFTMGYEVENEETYGSVLERRLRASGQDVEVLNAGVSGFSTAEEIVYLERELIRYDPDVVLIGFYFNDFTDNIRTNLFGVGEDGRLIEKNDDYVPLGRVGNFLNSNPVFNFLAGYSNSFVLLKERATLFTKRLLVAKNRGEAREAAERELEVTDATPAGAYKVSPYQERLLVALLERLYATCHERGIDLVIMSIPSGGITDRADLPDLPLVDRFPYDAFDRDRPGLALLAMAPVLRPHFGQEKLVHTRSHFHWTPFSHRLAGEALAELVVEQGRVERPPSRSVGTSD